MDVYTINKTAYLLIKDKANEEISNEDLGAYVKGVLELCKELDNLDAKIVEERNKTEYMY